MIRGNTVYWSVTFEDQDGNPISPSGATLHLNYLVDGTNTFEEVTLSDSGGGVFTGNWDSLKSSLGRVYWSVISTGTLHAVAEGQFELTGNRATVNLEPLP